jgi:hypothetical protein
MTGPDGSDLDSVRVAPMRSLSRFGGLCSQLNLEWPNGWQTPLRASAARPLGPDLEVTLDDLPGSRLAGALVGDRLLPTVFLDDQLLSSSAQLQPGGETRLRLAGPAPCVRANDGTPVPSNLRVLAQGDRGIQQRLVIVGPVLTRWLRLNCR